MGAALKIYHEENPCYLQVVHSPKLRVEQKSEIPFFELDYYAYGAIMPGRNFNSNSGRYGFNGMEKDDEITGITGTDYTAENWEYDARLGRRWNTDPVVKPFESPYATFANNPIFFSDPNGLDPTDGVTGQGSADPAPDGDPVGTGGGDSPLPGTKLAEGITLKEVEIKPQENGSGSSGSGSDESGSKNAKFLSPKTPSKYQLSGGDIFHKTPADNGPIVAQGFNGQTYYGTNVNFGNIFATEGNNFIQYQWRNGNTNAQYGVDLFKQKISNIGLEAPTFVGPSYAINNYLYGSEKGFNLSLNLSAAAGIVVGAPRGYYYQPVGVGVAAITRVDANFVIARMQFSVFGAMNLSTLQLDYHGGGGNFTAVTGVGGIGVGIDR